MMGFIGTACAAGTSAQQHGSILSFLPIIVLFIAIFYFMIWRPQGKRNKAQANLLKSMTKGNEVLTQGGLVGTIVKISDSSDYVVIALNDDNQITIRKNFIMAILPNNTIASAGIANVNAKETTGKKSKKQAKLEAKEETQEETKDSSNQE